MNKDILTVKDLNKYLPAVKTKVDIHFKDKLSEGLFKTDAIAGLKKIPNESVDLIVLPFMFILSTSRAVRVPRLVTFG